MQYASRSPPLSTARMAVGDTLTPAAVLLDYRRLSQGCHHDDDDDDEKEDAHLQPSVRTVSALPY